MLPLEVASVIAGVNLHWHIEEILNGQFNGFVAFYSGMEISLDCQRIQVCGKYELIPLVLYLVSVV